MRDFKGQGISRRDFKGQVKNIARENENENENENDQNPEFSQKFAEGAERGNLGFVF